MDGCSVVGVFVCGCLFVIGVFVSMWMSFCCWRLCNYVDVFLLLASLYVDVFFSCWRLCKYVDVF